MLTVLLLPEAWDAIRTIPRQAKHERVWYAKRGHPLTKGNHQSLWTPVRALWWGKLSDARRRQLVDFDWLAGREHSRQLDRPPGIHLSTRYPALSGKSRPRSRRGLGDGETAHCTECRLVVMNGLSGRLRVE
ncbi:MAG: hypothetical protein ACXWWU_10980 [Candidatus Limnocylindria bacterium]